MPHGSDKRERLLDAAHALMVERGLVGCTTREIARHADVAEGTIYNHFSDKYDLCLAVLRERSAVPERVRQLITGAGGRPPRQVLLSIVETYMKALEDIIPMLSGVIGRPDLAELHRRRADDSSPIRLLSDVADYLQSEQRSGRVGCGGDAVVLTHVLLGSAFHYVYLTLMLGEQTLPLRGRAYAEAIVDTVLAAAGRARKTPRERSRS